MLAVFILNVILDTQWRAYDVWPGLSWVMHGIGGFVVAWSTVRWYDRLPTSARPRVGPPAAAAFCLVGAAAMVGILWEVYEYFLDRVAAAAVQPSVGDTVADLVMDMAGAAVYCLAAWQSIKRRSYLGPR